MAGIASLTACNDDDWSKGNPTMGVKTDLGTACFGDSLRFTINASDSEVPLSTLRAQLYFGDEMVSEKVIRTKRMVRITKGLSTCHTWQTSPTDAQHSFSRSRTSTSPKTAWNMR